MYNLILIQETVSNEITRSMLTYDSFVQAKSRAYTELSQIGVSETLKSVRVKILDDMLDIQFSEDGNIEVR